MYFHQRWTGNAADFVGLVRSYSGIHRALKGGVSETELGVDQLQILADDIIGRDAVEWIFSYTMIVGMK